MRYVSIIEDKTYLLWQQEVQALNLQSIGQENLTVVVLYNGTISERAKNLENVCEVFYFENKQADRRYVPSNKPYGLKLLLEHKPEYGKDLFLLDSDVIFREVLDLSKMTDSNGLYMSDCTSYLGLDYIKSKYPEDRLSSLFSISGITPERIEEIKHSSGGAQYYFKTITPEFCAEVEEQSVSLYIELCKARDEVGSEIQVWTAEMWAWLWNGAKYFNIYVEPELDFSWGTDSLFRWENTKMLHLAGVVGKDMGLFYKGHYLDHAPWESMDFKYITRKDTCAWVYLEKMAEYKSFSLPVIGESKRRAVVVYLENKVSLLRQFKYLYKSFKISNMDTDTDLVVFTDDTSIPLPDDVKSYRFKSISLSGEFKDYHFINSVACIAENGELLSKYEYILKTDLDVFLTKELKMFYPPKFHTGTGNFTYGNVAERIKEFALRNGYTHKGIHNVGATWYGSGALVVQLAQSTMEIARKLNKEEFGEWPNWYKGVLSMYASEIAVNHNVEEFVLSNKFDVPSDSHGPIEEAYHIHCFHSNKMYSKFEEQDGKYDSITDIDRSIVCGYCLGVSQDAKQQT